MSDDYEAVRKALKVCNEVRLGIAAARLWGSWPDFRKTFAALDRIQAENERLRKENSKILAALRALLEETPDA